MMAFTLINFNSMLMKCNPLMCKELAYKACEKYIIRNLKNGNILLSNGSDNLFVLVLNVN